MITSKVILVIFMWSTNGGVAIDHIEFDNLGQCKNFAANVQNTESQLRCKCIRVMEKK